jgi:acetaldehyde dehydrogenase
MELTSPTRVAVLGAGLIGLDLIDKIRRSPALDCVLVVSRNRESVGLRRAAALGCATVDGGVTSLLACEPNVDLVFDASNADAHARHWSVLQPIGATLIDLTPARLGTVIVPTVNGDDALGQQHVSLVSCGGQAAIPVLHAIAALTAIDYVEIVCTAASATAGRATRLNLDDYIRTTREAVMRLCGAYEVKVMVNLSPARPAPAFRVAVTVLTHSAPPDLIHAAVTDAAHRVRAFTPGYEVVSCTVTEERISLSVQVTAASGHLPQYAGNLDIITAAAVMLGERITSAHRPARERRG